MSRHPGDPKSDATGEQPFDMTEGIHHYIPPAPPPPEPNALGYVPWRGAQQHGVAMTAPPEIVRPFGSADDALDAYTDPTVTPRDLVPPIPVAVTVVDNPSLLSRRQVRCSSFTVAVGTTFTQIAFPEVLRRRLIVRVCGSAGGSGRARVGTDPYPTTTMTALCPWVAGDSVVVLDTTAASAVYIAIDACSDPTATISVTCEYAEYDGNPIL